MYATDGTLALIERSFFEHTKKEFLGCSNRLHTGLSIPSPSLIMFNV